MVRRRGGTPGGYDPGGGSGDEEEDDDGPRTGGGSPSFPGGGGSGGGSDDDDDDSSLGGTAPNNGSDDDNGPRTGGGAPSFPGGSDPGPAPDPDPPDDDPDPSPGPSTGGGSPSVPGGSDPEPPEPDPDPSPGPSSPGGSPSVPGGVDPEPPEPDPDPSPGPSSPGGSPSVPGGSDPGPAPDNGGESGGSPGPNPGGNVSDPVADAADPTTPNPIDRAIGAGLERAGDTRAGEAIGAGADRLFGTDSPGGGASDDAIRFLDRRAQQINTRVADEIRAGGGEQPRSPAPGVGGLSAAADSPFVRDSAAQATELLNPAAFGRDLVVGSRVVAEGGDFLVDEGAEGVEQSGEALVDAGQAAPGAAVDAGEFVRDNPRDAAVTGTALVGTLGVGAAGGAATRAGARGVASGARRVSSAVDGSGEAADAVRTGRSDVGTGGADQILDAETVDQARGVTGPSRRSRVRGETSRRLDQLDDVLPGGSDRGQLQLGGQGRGTGRGRGGGETPDAPRDFDGEDRVSDNLVQQSLNRQQRAERGAVDRGDFEGAQDPLAGAGTRRGTISEGGDVALTRSTGAVDAGAETATRGATSRFSSTGGGAGATGAVATVNDPSGVAPDSTVSGGPAVDAVNDPTSIASTTAVTGTQQVDPANDPTAISPGVEDQLRDGRLGGGTLPGDATGTGTDALGETNDPTNIAPPDSRTDTGADTDTFAPTDTESETGVGTDQPPVADTDQPPVSDTDQPPLTDTPPVTDTPTPPVVDTPPVTDTPPTQTPRPPRRPPVLPPARPPIRRRPPRTPEEEEERDQQRQRDPERDADFGRFDIVDDGGPAVGFGAETFTALATGPFEERQVAEGSTDEFFTGELPAASFLNPDDDDEEGVEFVSGLFGLNLGFGGGGQNDA